MRNPLIAGTLSLLIPGLGQIYNGRILLESSMDARLWHLLDWHRWAGSV